MSFNILLNDNFNPERLIKCETTLRYLPGKRWAGIAQWGDKNVFVKLFLHPTQAERHWRREETGALALQGRGIQTPSLLYSGGVNNDIEDKNPDHLSELREGISVTNFDSFKAKYVLIFELITSARTLQEVWNEADDDLRLHLLQKLMAVLATHHRAGLAHSDMHFNNFLLQDQKLFTLDGDQVHLYAMPLKKGISLKNIALLFAQLPPHYDSLAKKLLLLYIEKRGLDASYNDLEKLKCSVRRARTRRTAKFLKKVFRESSIFACYKSPAQFTIHDRSYDSPLFYELLKNPERFMEDSRCQLIKRGNTATVGLINIHGQPLIIKRYNIKTLSHRISRALRITRAAISWRNANLLRFYEIGTPRPIALIEKRAGPFRSTSYFISAYLEGIDCMNYFSIATASARQEMALKIAILFEQMAAAKISHGDMKATNIIISEEKPFLIDLDSLCQHNFTSLFSRAHNRDQRRWLRNWKDKPDIKDIFYLY